MSRCLLILLIFSIYASGCNRKNSNEPSFVVKYQAQIISPEFFLREVLLTGYLKFRDQSFENLREKEEFNIIKREALERTIQTLFVNKIATENNIVIRDQELKKWIEERTVGLQKEDLNLFLNSTGLKLEDWTRLFKEQLLLHKVKQFLSPAVATDDKTKKPTLKSEKFPHVQIGVISFQDKHLAENAYLRLRKRQVSFESLMTSKTGSKRFDWIPVKSIPFASELKKLRLNYPSKAIKTDWGYSIVMVKARKSLEIRKNNANSYDSRQWLSMLNKFRGDNQLEINYDLFYSLNLTK